MNRILPAEGVQPQVSEERLLSSSNGNLLANIIAFV
jgi:hypothetical protein